MSDSMVQYQIAVKTMSALSAAGKKRIRKSLVSKSSTDRRKWP